jgi:type IV secretory pathway VirB2 component (pilin)
MKKLLDNLANMVKVKTVVTLVVILVFGILALRGAISTEQVMYIVTTVIAFYFGTQHDKK